MVKKQKELDITKTGPVGYRSLQAQNNAQFDEVDRFINESQNRILSRASQSDPYRDTQQMVKSPLAETGTSWGESIWDNKSANQASFENLGDIRAENQPWYAQIGAGLAKGAILAGTTFLDGTLGLLFGAETAISEDRWSGLWDNDFSKAMQSVNEWSEQALPNYYTKAEQEQPWYENIFTANFLGDKFIKNLGFTIGAFYSGGVTAAGLKATKLPQLIGAIAKSSKAPAIVNSAVGATISAVNEGRIEALNNSKDWFELHKAQLDDEYHQRLQYIKNAYEGTEVYDQLIRAEQENYNQALGRLSEDRLKMGNVDLLMNIPILIASNIIQFGKLYANGFKTARKATNIVGKAGEYTAGTTRLGATTAITKGALSEGIEEISQKAASVISGNYYSTDVNNFYKSKTDPEAAQETLSWTKSFAEGINETVNDGSSWEEFFIGSLTGALGMPRFRGVRSESGSLQSPITIEGGAINEWREYNEKIARENKIANYMNNRINSPEFKNYYQGLIRHNKYQNDMNRAAEEGDEFNFKNAEHAQLVSDIAMFDNAGKMEDLTTLIDAAFDTSDENLASIVENTTTTLEDGSKVGPFVDKNGNPMYATPEGKQEMIKKLQQNHNEMTNTINNYLKIKDELDIKTGQQLSDDQLEELTWMKSQIGNWAERATSMSGEIKSAIGNVIGNLDSLLRFNQQVRDFEGQHNANLTDRYKQADKNVKTIEGAINTLNMVRGQDDSVLAHTLATSPKFVDGLIKEINEVDETVLSADEKEDITTKLNDIVKLGNASKTYNAKLKEYLENPQKQAEDHARADEQAVQQETKKKSDDLKASLNAAQNLQEFRNTIDAQDDTENRDKVLKELEDEGSEMAKNYRETSQYNNEVRRVLNESDAEPQVKQDAMKLLQDQFNNSDNLEYLANPNSIYINNENAFDEDSEGDVDLSATRFQEAQYELQKAMSKVNNDNRFKDRFSPEYKKPVEKREGTVRGDDRTTTGDSGTSTTPTVTSSEGLPTTELPVGNITAEMVREENKKANEMVETPQRPSRDTSNQFYRPAIPELHIEASKEGDFRPFDVVVGEREKGVDFSGIYGYLRDSGAFRYLNEGNLKAGYELGFMIDPSFNDHTIFIIDKRNGQVVGSLDESDYSVSRYEGLKGLEEKIRKEYAERGSQSSKPSDDEVKNFIIEETIKYYRDVIGNPLTKESIDIMNKTSLGGLYTSTYASSLLKDPAFKNKVDDFTKSTNQKGKFIATPTTRVSKVMVGRIPYDNTDRSLSEIPNVSSTDRKPIFGIIKNGVLTTNSKIDGNLIIKPVDMSQKEGRLYLLIPNGAGKYSPAAVRVKHFNNEEFNLNDSGVNSTPVGEDIKNAITKLSTATSHDDVSAAMQDLAQDLYMQDVMVTWFSSKAGDGIVISKKVRKPDGTYEKVIINGKEQIKEDKYDVYFSTSSKSAEIGGINFDATALETLGDTSALGTPKNPEDIYNEILGHLVKFNLPLQVSVRRINEGTYNNRLINSNILTSNITEASVKSNWFTTDYFDNEGNLHQAINPASVARQPKRKVETPVGGTEGAIAGTRIVSVFSNKPYYVDLKTNTIRDNQGRTVKVTDSNRILFDLAWAQDNFGNATNSSMMVDNKVLTPDGKVLDRNKQRYLSGQEAQDVKDTIAGRKKEREDRVAKSKEIISEIYENQKRVDKTRTDGEFYYILEDDGEYHQYSRVHSRLGSNWVESPKQTKALKDIEIQLSKLVMASPTGYNNYLDTIGKRFEVDLSAFHNKMGIKDRQAIVNTIRDRMSGTNSQRALDAGSAVDSIIRQYFTVRDISKIVRPSNMSESAFVDLITSLNKIKSNMELLGERFLADNIVLFQKYPDGTRVAGEVDILSIDKDGNFRIYDVKTSRYSFSDFTDRYGHKVNYFTTPSATQRMSAKDYYTLQLSAYKNLFESQYGVPVTKLAIMPFVLSYDKKNVSAVQSEKGIHITYNPAVNVPLVGNVKVDKPVETPATPAQAQTVLPIFETSLETQNPIEDLTPEHKSTDKDKVGYFELDGKLHKGYITPLTVIDGIEVHITKVPNITKGFGRQGEVAHVASNSFYAVFPNGKTFLFLNNNPVQGGKTQEEVEKAIKNALEGNKQRVKDLSSEKTILFDPDAVPTVSAAPVTTVETPATINQGNTQTGAAYTVQKEQAIDNKKASRTRHKLRKVKSPDYEKWDEKKELEWLNKVLPQLSESDRVKVVKGLIKVGKRGTLAWGQFDKGVITLSDIAAEGTAYHEAFHVVFNLLLDNDERQALYDEAKKLYGEKDNLSLEEDMAEGFREYVTTRQNAGLLGKIKNFFKDLWIKVTNWNSVRPHLTAYYQMINRGEYSNRKLPVETLSQARARQEEYSKEMQDILANAKRDSEGNLLAPNGKKSNLTERQYAQVRTKAFKDWFGDWENNPSEASKVVDENGEPLVVYHGTDAEFTVFDNSKNDFSYKGFYFTDSKKMAGSYKGDILMPVFLNIRDYYKVNAKGRNWNNISDSIAGINSNSPLEWLKNIVKQNSLELEKAKRGHYDNFFGGYIKDEKRIKQVQDFLDGLYVTKLYNEYENIINSSYNSIIEKAIKYFKLKTIEHKAAKLFNDNYYKYQESISIHTRDLEVVFSDRDGIIINNVIDYGSKVDNPVPNDVYIVYNPNQLKSATDNVGTFSRTDDDIRYREVTNKEQVLRQETQAFLDNFDISIKDLDNYDSDVPLFDALNRVINVKDANDITEGVGYAVAFMMQYNPRISELINLHIHGSETFRLKGIRRSIRNRGTFSLDLSSRERRAINRQEAIKQIGADIAVELRKLYNLETPKDTSNSYIKNIWNAIKEFFEKLTPRYRATLSIIANNTNQIANAIKLNDPSIIRARVNKPGTNTTPERVDIGKALIENPYEDNIIRTLQEYNIALAGSASIAIEGTLYRPSENPLHDIDFNAVDYNREQLDTIIDKEFPHNTHIRTIKDGENKTTETYLILDRDFYTEKVEGLGLYKLIDKNTKEVLGSYVGSELTLKDGVQGKFLDFFIGKDNRLFDNKKVLLNNREYIIADYRNAFQAKIDWSRLKDIWDYNRFVSSGKVKTLEALRAESERNLKNKLQNARVIWGHPAIGKTTYLERNDDILEWDDLVNKKRNEFLRNQIDPSHTMDIESNEYKHLRSEYMMNWKKHPEYIKFLTDEWNNLIARAKRENKRVFASPLPLLEIGRKDIDLIVALGDRAFTERDLQRGNTLYSSRGWKQSIDKELLKQDPTKIVYTEDYFSDFMRKNLGVTWGTLNETEEEMLLAKGWTKERFDSISQEERDQAVKCIAF